ncbi:MAG: hypothetical protein M1831_003934 [Alyxoria varia]|nr:MAG: hypothetical protein M1831_003934 [Alyxoria varia]
MAFSSMALDNDTRGWIMTVLSAIACVVGSTFICVDILVRLCSKKHQDFRIENSNGFLSCSMSLSAGVMLFSALYNMLPSGKKSLRDGGASPKAAGWILIVCFLGGVFGIQVFSRFLHRFLPSHAVDCDHTHENEQDAEQSETENPAHSHRHDSLETVKSKSGQDMATEEMVQNETTPLLSRSATEGNINRQPLDGPFETSRNTSQRPSLPHRVTAKLSNMVSSQSPVCEDGPCLGYSDPCGDDCFKKVLLAGGVKGATATRVLKNAAASLRGGSKLPHKHTDEEWAGAGDSSSTNLDRPSEESSDTVLEQPKQQQTTQESSHHHHIPANAFLSISLQTCIAIALHKLPEGFITYATNHANPSLGLSVFLALFIHNLSEGFALALPILLATGSRARALIISTILGGFSQPLGAGIAAIWLQIAEKDRGDADVEEGINSGVYGAMFAITAGIMASVAVGLLREGFELGHNKNMCMAFVFVGMGILGISSALTV